MRRCVQGGGVGKSRWPGRRCCKCRRMVHLDCDSGCASAAVAIAASPSSSQGSSCSNGGDKAHPRPSSTQDDPATSAPQYACPACRTRITESGTTSEVASTRTSPMPDSCDDCDEQDQDQDDDAEDESESDDRDEEEQLLEDEENTSLSGIDPLPPRMLASASSINRAVSLEPAGTYQSNSVDDSSTVSGSTTPQTYCHSNNGAGLSTGSGAQFQLPLGTCRNSKEKPGLDAALSSSSGAGKKRPQTGAAVAKAKSASGKCSSTSSVLAKRASGNSGNGGSTLNSKRSRRAKNRKAGAGECNKAGAAGGGGTEEREEHTGTVVVCRADDAFLLEQDICVSCGSIGLDAPMLCCVQCGQCYHSYCAEVTKLTRALVEKGWRCLDCTVCEGCGRASDESLLLLCDDCDTSYHTFCLDPPLREVPRGPWKCSACVLCHCCGRRDPGPSEGARWQSNFTSCAPCASRVQCPVCDLHYQDGDLMLLCDLCERSCHAACDQLHSELELEFVFESGGYHCVLCRERGLEVGPGHRQLLHLRATHGESLALSLLADKTAFPALLAAAAAGGAQSGAGFDEPGSPADASKNFYMDSVVLSECGLSTIRSAMLKTQPRRNLTALRRAQKSAAAARTEPETTPVSETAPAPLAASHMDEDSLQSAEGDPKSPSLQSDDGSEAHTAKAAPATVTAASVASGKSAMPRNRRFSNLGIGGFRARATRVSQAKKGASGSGPPGAPGNDPSTQYTIENSTAKQSRRRQLKKKSEIEENYPDYLMQAFLGAALLNQPPPPATTPGTATGSMPDGGARRQGAHCLQQQRAHMDNRSFGSAGSSHHNLTEDPDDNGDDADRGYMDNDSDNADAAQEASEFMLLAPGACKAEPEAPVKSEACGLGMGAQRMPLQKGAGLFAAKMEAEDPLRLGSGGGPESLFPGVQGGGGSGLLGFEEDFITSEDYLLDEYFLSINDLGICGEEGPALAPGEEEQQRGGRREASLHQQHQQQTQAQQHGGGGDDGGLTQLPELTVTDIETHLGPTSSLEHKGGGGMRRGGGGLDTAFLLAPAQDHHAGGGGGAGDGLLALRQQQQRVPVKASNQPVSVQLDLRGQLAFQANPRGQLSLQLQQPFRHYGLPSSVSDTRPPQQQQQQQLIVCPGLPSRPEQEPEQSQQQEPGLPPPPPPYPAGGGASEPNWLLHTQERPPEQQQQQQQAFSALPGSQSPQTAAFLHSPQRSMPLVTQSSLQLQQQFCTQGGLQFSKTSTPILVQVGPQQQPLESPDKAGKEGLLSPADAYLVSGQASRPKNISLSSQDASDASACESSTALAGTTPATTPTATAACGGSTQQSNKRINLIKWQEDEQLGEKSTIAPILFSNSLHPNLRSQYQDIQVRSREIQKLWRKLNSDDRQHWVNKSRMNKSSKKSGTGSLQGGPPPSKKKKTAASASAPAPPASAPPQMGSPTKFLVQQQQQQQQSLEQHPTQVLYQQQAQPQQQHGVLQSPPLIQKQMQYAQQYIQQQQQQVNLGGDILGMGSQAASKMCQQQQQMRYKYEFVVPQDQQQQILYQSSDFLGQQGGPMHVQVQQQQQHGLMGTATTMEALRLQQQQQQAPGGQQKVLSEGDKGLQYGDLGVGNPQQQQQQTYHQPAPPPTWPPVSTPLMMAAPQSSYHRFKGGSGAGGGGAFVGQALLQQQVKAEKVDADVPGVSKAGQSVFVQQQGGAMYLGGGATQEGLLASPSPEGHGFGLLAEAERPKEEPSARQYQQYGQQQYLIVDTPEGGKHITTQQHFQAAQRQQQAFLGQGKFGAPQQQHKYHQAAAASYRTVGGAQYQLQEEDAQGQLLGPEVVAQIQQSPYVHLQQQQQQHKFQQPASRPAKTGYEGPQIYSPTPHSPRAKTPMSPSGKPSPAATAAQLQLSPLHFQDAGAQPFPKTPQQRDGDLGAFEPPVIVTRVSLDRQSLLAAATQEMANQDAGAQFRQQQQQQLMCGGADGGSTPSPRPFCRSMSAGQEESRALTSLASGTFMYRSPGDVQHLQQQQAPASAPQSHLDDVIATVVSESVAFIEDPGAIAAASACLQRRASSGSGESSCSGPVPGHQEQQQQELSHDGRVSQQQQQQQASRLLALGGQGAQSPARAVYGGLGAQPAPASNKGGGGGGGGGGGNFWLASPGLGQQGAAKSPMCLSSTATQVLGAFGPGQGQSKLIQHGQNIYQMYSPGHGGQQIIYTPSGLDLQQQQQQQGGQDQQINMLTVSSLPGRQQQQQHQQSQPQGGPHSYQTVSFNSQAFGAYAGMDQQQQGCKVEQGDPGDPRQVRQAVVKLGGQQQQQHFPGALKQQQFSLYSQQQAQGAVMGPPVSGLRPGGGQMLQQRFICSISPNSGGPQGQQGAPQYVLNTAGPGQPSSQQQQQQISSLIISNSQDFGNYN